jgi:hypothetical protein
MDKSGRGQKIEAVGGPIRPAVNYQLVLHAEAALASLLVTGASVQALVQF